MAYKVVLERKAVKAFQKLSEPYCTQIRAVLEGLRENPLRASHITRLKTPLQGFRARSGDYRILYTVNKRQVVVYSIAHRKDAYKF